MAAQQSANEQWSEEKTMKLIEVYKKNETLWKKSHATFFNHYIKPHAWEEVAVAMNSTPEICMNKIRILKAMWYRKREKKIRDEIASGVDPEVARNKAIYLTPLTKALDFLKENEIKVIKKDSVVINDENNQSSSSTSQVPQLDEGIIELLKVKQKRSLSFKNKIGGKRAGKRSVSEITMDKNAPQKIARISENNKNDIKNKNYVASQGKTTKNQQEGPSFHSENEIKYFSKFIAAKIKKFTKMTKNAVQHEICEILFKADQNYFDMSSEDSEIVDLDSSLELVSDARRDFFYYDECDVVVD